MFQDPSLIFQELFKLAEQFFDLIESLVSDSFMFQVYEFPFLLPSGQIQVVEGSLISILMGVGLPSFLVWRLIKFFLPT